MLAPTLCVHAHWHIFWFSVALSLQWEFSLCLSPSVCFIHAPSSYWQNSSPFFVHPLLLQPCLLLWQHLPTVTKVKFQKGLKTSSKHNLPFLLHPKHCWPREEKKLPAIYGTPPPKHAATVTQEIMESLINRKIAKFPWNQQTVDSSRMSSRMTEKNIACTGTTRLNRLGDCPVKAVKEMQKTVRATFDTSCNQHLWTALLKSNWLWTLTDSSLNNKNKQFPHSTVSLLLASKQGWFSSK